jgi:RNA polymerase sigma factor (sigma-70 family)
MQFPGIRVVLVSQVQPEGRLPLLPSGRDYVGRCVSPLRELHFHLQTGHRILRRRKMTDDVVTNSMPKVQTDEDFCCLIREIRAGSEDAAWELVAQFGEQLRRAVRRALNAKLRSKFDSVDFVQLVWKSLFRVRDKLERFDRPEELAAYLTVMAQNKVGMQIRQQLLTAKRNVAREQSFDQLVARDPTQFPSREPEQIEVAIARERWDRLMQEQPAHYRQIIQLRLQGHTQAGIAKTVGVDESTVRRFLTKLLQTAVP